MAKLSSKNKILIASILIGVLVIGAIVSLVIVLAASQQNVSTNVIVRYTVDGVAAKVTANYATIPTGVTALSTGLFNSCKKLTSITIPNNITKISGNAFRACNNLISIIVESGNSVYSSGNENNCIIETATNTLIRGCETTIITDGITKIAGDAFSGVTGLTELTIPSSVTSIGDNAFLWSGLTSITIPSSVTSIGYGAFEGCSNLTNVIFENRTSWGAYSGTILKYEIADLSNTATNAANLKNLSSNSSLNVNWGYYQLKREA